MLFVLQLHGLFELSDACTAQPKAPNTIQVWWQMSALQRHPNVQHANVSRHVLSPSQQLLAQDCNWPSLEITDDSTTLLYKPQAHVFLFFATVHRKQVSMQATVAQSLSSAPQL
jgi:hypothetical protein